MELILVGLQNNMKITIPNLQTKQLRQLNKGNLFGELFGTFNIDLISAPGKIRLSPSLNREISNISLHTDDIVNANLGHVWGFSKNAADGTNRWWAGAGSVLFKVSGANWAQDTIAIGDGTPTDLNYMYSDMVSFEGALVVSTSTDLHKLTSGSWDRGWWITTLAQTGLTASIYHPLHTWERTLLIGDTNKLHIIDKDSIVTTNRIILPPEYYIIKIISCIDRVWILTRHIYEGEAMIFEWDGKSSSYFRQHSAKANQCLSGVTGKNGLAYVMNSNGQLLEFTGSGFEEVACLPISSEVMLRLKGESMQANWNDSWTLNRMVHPNGMAMIDDKIYVLLSGAVRGFDYYLFENMMSGIWVYTKENGFFHYSSLTLNNHLGTHKKDYGTGVVLYPGALVSSSDYDVYAGKRTFLTGGTIYSDDMTTEIKAIFNNEYYGPHSGFIIYSRLSTSEIQNMWDKIWLKFSQMRSIIDKIIVKKRIIKNLNLPVRANINWTNATTFTTTTSNFQYAVAGNEVFVFVGRNAGLTAHITNISYVNSTYTVTIDETGLDTSGTAQIYVYDWVKVGSFSDNNFNKQFVDFALGGESTYIDIKIVFVFSAEIPELEETIITSKVNLTAQ